MAEKPFTPKRQIKVKSFGRHKGSHGTTKVFVHINEFTDGTAFIDSRQFMKDDAGDYQPTAKGLSIHKDHVYIYREALDKAISKMERLGIVKPPKKSKRTKES